MNYTQVHTIEELLAETIEQAELASNTQRPIAKRAEAAENVLMLLKHATSEARLGAEKFYNEDGTLREQARP